MKSLEFISHKFWLGSFKPLGIGQFDPKGPMHYNFLYKAQMQLNQYIKFN